MAGIPPAATVAFGISPAGRKRLALYLSYTTIG
jgi:hypothetical protein